MRPRLDWMGKYDTAILELLEKTELALPPKVIAFNLDYLNVASPATSTVQRRLGTLEQNDFVTKLDEKSGYYTISSQGEAYLDGDISGGTEHMKQDRDSKSSDYDD